MGRKLPIGIQSFEKLREEGFAYVDKTAHVYQLVQNTVPCFLLRPRRFGKSLLLSTLRAYWEGKKALFTGLAISELEAKNREAWKPYPVFSFDFNGENYGEPGALERSLDFQMQQWESRYACDRAQDALGERVQKLLIQAKERTGLRSVILADDYDKPLLDAARDKALQVHNQEVLKGFFSTFKRCDEDIHFIFITGVSSIFSDLNQLKDISLSKQYSVYVE